MVESSKLTTKQLTNIIETQALLVSGQFDLPSFARMVAERVQALTGATGAVVEIVDGDEMVYEAASGSVAAFVGLRLRQSSSLSGACVKTGEIAIANDTSCDPRVDKAACEKLGVASMIVVPLYRARQVVGVIKVVSNEINAFDHDAVNTLELMAGMLGGALGQQIEIKGRQVLEEELLHQAQSDFLTDLPNRILFNDRLSHAVKRNMRNKSGLAVMYIDVDFFKQVNDTYGHAIGDQLLRAFTQRVRGCIRASDTLARLGGDEFAIIVEDVGSKMNAEVIACKIVEAAARPFLVEGKIIKIGASVGIAFSIGEMNPARLMLAADEALYVVKKDGRGLFQLVDA